jgi:pimeloyl-ACP methyl ester carboxylesterase
MGSLVSVATAAADPERVNRIALIGTSDRMAVHPQLLAAAQDQDPLAVDLIVGWSHSGRSRFGGHRQAGVWTTQQTRRLVERNIGPLGTDLAACVAFDPALAPPVNVDALVISGERDVMTPARAGGRMAALLGADHHVVPDGSHVSLYDHPGAVNAVLLPWMGTLP